MTDPAQDIEDFRQDAHLAVYSGRLSPQGIPTAIENSKRTSHRRAKCHVAHQDTLRQHQQRLRERRGPDEKVSDQDDVIRVVGVLYEKYPKLLAILLLREIGISRSHIAEATGLSEGTVSRAPRRAKEILAGLGD